MSISADTMGAVAPFTARRGFEWALALVTIVAAIVMPFVNLPPTFAILILTIPFTISHGVRRYGAKTFLIFFVVTFLISNAFEDLSIVSGFPFGHYHYTGPGKLLYVPIMIGPIYFGLGYISWTIASTILDQADTRLGLGGALGRLNRVALPVIAGAIMTMFDVGSDSTASTLGKTWIWHDGGGLFGVPYTNYLGWWFVTYAFFQVFALLLARKERHPGQARPADMAPADQLTPVVIYFSLALGSVFSFIAVPAGAATVADATGALWNVAALGESMMIINIFSCVTVVLIALTKIAQRASHAR